MFVPLRGVFLNSIEALWMIIRKNCFRPLIEGSISNQNGDLTTVKQENPFPSPYRGYHF